MKSQASIHHMNGDTCFLIKLGSITGLSMIRLLLMQLPLMVTSVSGPGLFQTRIPKSK